METEKNTWEARASRNIWHLGYWTAGWVATIALAAFGPKFLWNHDTALSISAIAVNLAMGIGMILMNRKYTNGLDEMQRKIMMDAKAVALGTAVVGGLSYALLEQTKILPFRAEIGHLVILISIAYFIAVIIGSIRYK